MYILYLVLNTAESNIYTNRLRLKKNANSSLMLYSLVLTVLVTAALDKRVMEYLSGVRKVGGSTEKQH